MITYNEWSEKTINFATGCENNCRYCYAKGMAVRFKQVVADQWKTMRVRQHDVDKKHRNYGELVMFPSSHDITPKVLNEAVIVLRKLLEAGNEVLVVSKPRFECIKLLCDTFGNHHEQILFRFTIGARDNSILEFWEPGAPTFEERLNALRYAFENGFNTSVSVEPVLKMDDTEALYLELKPFINESIWFGKMNHMEKNLKFTGVEVDRIIEGQTDEKCRALYERLKDEPMVRFKSGFVR